MACGVPFHNTMDLICDLLPPIIRVSFEKDCVDPLGEIWGGSASWISMFWEVHVRELCPNLVVVEHLCDWGLGLETCGGRW